HWLALGFAASFAAQTVIMVGAAFNLWPLTGLTLAPLASGKAALISAAVPAWAVLWASGGPKAPIAARADRARIISWAYAPLGGLALRSRGQAGRVSAVESDRTALQHAAGSPGNRRVLAERGELRAGAIRVRDNGTGFDARNLVALAQDAPGRAGGRR